MKRIICIALATLMISPVGFAYSMFLAEAMAADAPRSELVVIGAPTGFEATAKKIGFSNIEKVSLDSLDLAVFRINVLESAADAAIDKLERRFPDAVIDRDSLGF